MAYIKKIIYYVQLVNNNVISSKYRMDIICTNKFVLSNFLENTFPLSIMKG